MITFKTIKWKNFLSYGNQLTTLDFEKSKTNIITATNGSGKSTILDVLSFALYGKPYRNISKAQVINSINNKDCYVELSFDIGKVKYIVKRGLKPTIFEIYKNDKLINQNSKSKDYQKYFEETIIKMNMKSFNQIVVLGSAKHLPFMQLPTSYRREIIEDMLDLTIFSKMVDVNKTLLAENTNKSKDLIFKVELLKKDINIQNEKIKTFNEINAKNNKSDKELLDRYKSELLSSLNTFNVNNDNIKKYNDKIAEKNKDLIENQLKKYNDFLSKIRYKINDNNNTINFYNNNNICPTCSQDINTIKDKLLPIKEKNNKVLNNFVSIIENQYTSLNSDNDEIIRLDKKMNELLIVNRGLKRNIVNIKNEIDAVNNKDNTDINISIEVDKLNELKGSLKTLMSELNEVYKNIKYNKIIADLLKDGGIKSKIIKTYIPLINKLVNKYLSDMNFYISFYLDENFNEVIKSRNRDIFSYNSFSEGEKLRIDLALLFTWRELSRVRNSTNTNLIILDEITDSSLDEDGTKCFMKLLNELPNEIHSFIISHNDEIKNYFNRVIEINKVNNFSVIGEI